MISVDFSVISLSSNTGSLYGGNQITFNGLGFHEARPEDLKVTFGDNSCENLQVISNSKVTCQVPSSSKNHRIYLSLDDQNQLSWQNEITIYQGDTITWVWNWNNAAYDMRNIICSTSQAGSYKCDPKGFTSHAERAPIGQFTKKYSQIGNFYVTTGCVTNNCQNLMANIIVQPRPNQIDVPISVKTLGFHQTNTNNRVYHYTNDVTAVVYDTYVDPKLGISILDEIVIQGNHFDDGTTQSSAILNNWKVYLGDFKCNVRRGLFS